MFLTTFCDFDKVSVKTEVKLAIIIFYYETIDSMSTKEPNWCQHFRSFMGGILVLYIPAMWLFPDFYLFLPSHKLTF